MSKPQILQTTRYSMFKSVVGNRIINKEHIARLCKEIQKNNLLATCPIIVNEKKQVIDGQHRLAAAERLRLPVFYVEVPGLGIEHIVRLNTSQRRWSVYDYIKLWIEQGNDNYAYLSAFMQQYGITPSIATTLIANSSYNTTKQVSFREGRFVVDNATEGHKLAQVMKDLVGNYRTSVTQRSDAYAAAIKRTSKKLKDNGYTIDDLVAAVKGEGLVIENYSRVRDYLRDFEKVLLKAKIRVRLF